MNFENFLKRINVDEGYKALVKDLLTNNRFAMHDASSKYLKEKDLLLFAARFDPFIPEFMDRTLKSDKEFLLKLIKRNNKTSLHIDVLNILKAE